MEDRGEDAASTDLARQPLRQVKELEQARLIPIERPDRRLADANLVDAIRRASDDTTRLAVKPVNEACFQELQGVCSKHTWIAQSVLRSANGDSNSPLMVEAHRGVHLCLATYSDSLNPDCVATLMKEFLKSQGQPLADPSVNRKTARHGKTHGGSPRMRRNEDGQGQEDDSEEDRARPGDQIYGWTKNDAAMIATPSNPGLGQWDQKARHHRHRPHHDDSDGVHPVVWALVLPFFCVGVFVSVKRALTMYKQRRLNAPSCAASHEYVPLSTHASSN